MRCGRGRRRAAWWSSSGRLQLPLDVVEELPPQLQGASERAPDLVLPVGRGGVTHDDVIADVAVIAVGFLVDIPEGDLLARQPIVSFERACERRERAGHLALGCEIDGSGAFDE